MGRITPKQQQIYNYILTFSNEHGYPPTVREIAQAVDLKSPSTVHFHMKSLIAAGLLIQAEGKTRSVTINPDFAPPRKDRIPIVGTVAAGIPILAEEFVEDYLIFDTGDKAGEFFALKVRGESMLNAGILPGDLVVVHQQTSVRNHDIAVAIFDNEATIKTYQRDDDGHVWLLPENDEYPVLDGTGCRILGRVVAVVRRY